MIEQATERRPEPDQPRDDEPTDPTRGAEQEQGPATDPTPGKGGPRPEEDPTRGAR
jgi:hypothetical protein